MASVREGAEFDMINSILKARDWLAHNPSLEPYWYPPGCCVGMTGNVNDDSLDNVDISDAMAMVNCLFVDFTWCDRICYAEANTSGDASCIIDISDLTALINHLFVDFKPLPPCNPDCER